MKQIAQTERAKFEYWIQEKWTVLPTDPRYTDLTEEQIDLLYEQYIRLHPPPTPPEQDGKARDEDYDMDSDLVEGYDPEQAKEDGRLPLADSESFSDPDFDEEWDRIDEVSDSDIVPENSSDEDFQGTDEGDFIPMESPIDLEDDDEWEEV